MIQLHHTHAWAGCGKTTKLVDEFIRFVDEGTKVQDIAFISFTKNVVETVKSRLLERNFPADLIDQRIRTFHSIGYKMSGARGTIIADYDWCLRAHGSIPAFNHQNPVYKEYWNKYNVDRQGLRAEGYTGAMEWFVKAYEKWKADNNLMDFTDMLYKVYTEKHILPYKILFVDEIQDCTPLMFAILKQWNDAQPGALIRSAGDVDQSIYAFGGAGPFGLLDFVDSFCDEDKTVDKLSKTYRLPENIYQLAESYARKNKRRIEQNLETARPGGEIKYVGLPGIAPGLREHLMAGLRCVVLVRDHYTLKLARDRFKAYGIPVSLPVAVQRAIDIVQGGPEQRLSIEMMKALDSPMFPNTLFYRGAKAEFGRANRDYELDDIFNHHEALGLNRGHGMFTVEGYEMFKNKDMSVLKLSDEDKRYYDSIVNRYGDMRNTVSFHTMHEFKGNEADVVMIIPYCTQPPFLSLRSALSDIQEEERRVWLNAITRSKQISILVKMDSLTSFSNVELIAHYENYLKSL